MTLLSLLYFTGCPIDMDEAKETSSVAVTAVLIVDSSGNDLGDSSSLYTTESSNLYARVTPDDATNQTVIWSSDNTTVATVDSDGLVTALSDGIANIVVSTDDGSFTDTLELTVTTEIIEVTGIVITDTDGNDLGDYYTLYNTETVDLDTLILPTNATDQAVSWTSSDTDVATVSSEGVVEPVSSSGNVQITVTTVDGSKSDTINISVSTYTAVTDITYYLYVNDTQYTAGETATVAINDEIEFDVIMLPYEASNNDYTIEFSNDNLESQASSSSYTAYVDAVKEGSCTVTIRSEDNQDVSFSQDFIISSDTSGPSLDGMFFIDSDTIYAYYSELIDSSDLITSSYYSLILDPEDTATTVEISQIEDIDNPDSSEVYIHLTSPLSVGDLVELTVTDVKDIAGNTISTSYNTSWDKYDNIAEATYTPSLDVTIDTDQMIEIDGQLSISSSAIDASNALSNFNTVDMYLYIVEEGDTISLSTLLAWGDASNPTVYFLDPSTNESVTFSNGTYDIIVGSNYDVDGDFNTDDDQFSTFSDPISYTVTTGL